MTWMGRVREVRGRVRQVATGDLRHARWLFVASLGLVVAAFGLFAGSERAADPATYYQYRVVAGASAGCALALAPLAVVRALTRGRAVAVSIAAAGTCGVAVAGFAWAYPARWNGTGPADLTVEVAALYTVAITTLFVVLWVATVRQVYAEFAPVEEEVDPRSTFERAFADHDPATDPGFNWVGDREE